MAFQHTTLADGRWQEFLCNAVWGSEDYRTSLHDTDNYFFQFALAAQMQKHERDHTKS